MSAPNHASSNIHKQHITHVASHQHTAQHHHIAMPHFPPFLTTTITCPRSTVAIQQQCIYKTMLQQQDVLPVFITKKNNKARSWHSPEHQQKIQASVIFSYLFQESSKLIIYIYKFTCPVGSKSREKPRNFMIEFFWINKIFSYRISLPICTSAFKFQCKLQILALVSLCVNALLCLNCYCTNKQYLP